MAALCTVNVSVSSVSHCVPRITAALPAAAAAAAVPAALAAMVSQLLLQQTQQQHNDETALCRAGRNMPISVGRLQVLHDAMQARPNVVMRCLTVRASICMSVTFVDCVKTSNFFTVV